jgi:hypothetical protein
MEIVITPEARKYLEGKKAGVITVAAGERPGGSCAKGCVCSAVYPTVKIAAVKPHNQHSYFKTVVDGIEVYYLDRLATVFKTVTVKIEKLVLIKSLVALGEK